MPRLPRRRGTVYVAVLGVAMIVAVMATTGVMVARLELRVAAAEGDRHNARLLARSAVEYAVNWMNHSNDWRVDLTCGVASSNTNFGGGDFSWVVIDADGALDDDPSDAVTLRGVGRYGSAVAVEEVTLLPTGDPLDCLGVALCVGSTVTAPAGTLAAPTVFESDQTIAVNGNLNASASYAQIDADAWATGTITGTVSGANQPGQSAPKQMPSDAAFAYYKAVGTPISVASLPLVGGSRLINKCVLSPASNPFGTTNPEGVYVVDCQGQKVEVKLSRVVGTLVLLNPGPGSGVTTLALMKNHVPNYPALLVDGDCRLDLSVLGNPLFSEALNGVNLNPPGTPFAAAEDSDTSDIYTASIAGLVHVRGVLTFNGGTKTDGCVVAGGVTSGTSYHVTTDFRSTFFDYPPPGFAVGPGVAIVPGSWRRGVAP